MRILQIRFKNLNSLAGEWIIDLTGVASRNGKNSTLRVVLPSHPQEFKPITAGCAIRCYMAVKRLACNPQFLA